MDRGGADDKVHIVGDVLGVMALENGYSGFFQRHNVRALADIRTRDHDVHPLQDLRQRGHGHAADADQMSLSSGRQIIVKFSHNALPCFSMCAECAPPPLADGTKMC